MAKADKKLKTLARCNLFKTLPQEGLALAAAACVEGNAKEGEAIVVEGTPADALYVVVAGQVDYVKRVDAQRGLVISRWREGDVFGLNALMDGAGHIASALATTAVKYLQLPAEDFRKLCAADPVYEHRILTQMILLQSSRLRHVTDRLREFLVKILK